MVGRGSNIPFGMGIDGFKAMQLADDPDVPFTAREGRSFVACMDPAASPAEGDTIRLLLEPQRVQLFDARSSENLIPAGRAGVAEGG